MAMSGPNGGADDDLESVGGVFADINITPLTDIFLVLLIIFMVTTTAIHDQSRNQTAGLEVHLPRGSAQATAGAAHDLAVAVLEDGRTVVGGKVVDAATLEQVFAQTASSRPETVVLVQADQGVAHGKVVAVMDLARRLGLSNLAIATRADRE
jgi:biopolymer transport protein ExbD